MLVGWETRNVYRILVGKHLGKQLLGRPRGKLKETFRWKLRR